MNIQPVVQYASRTDVGMRRAENQDSLAVRLCDDYEDWIRCGHLFVVADGMGGHSVGDLASRITVDTLPMAYRKADVETIPDRLRSAIRSAHASIREKSRQNPEFADMGTTCSVLALSEQGAWVGHVGDSRIYRVRDGVIEQLTFDHSLLWEVIRRGQATPEAAEMLHPRNVITRCLGPDERVEIDIEGPFDVRKGDRFVLCSDGLTGHVTDAEIGGIVSELAPAESSWLLVDLANCRGGSDNSTVVVAGVSEYPPVTGDPVDRPIDRPAATRRTDPEFHMMKGLQGRLLPVSFGVMAATGLLLLVLWEDHTPGLIFVAVALVLGLIRLLLLAARDTVSAGTFESANDAGSFESDPEINLTGIAQQSPYRRASFVRQSQFLNLLSSAQTELTDAARDNGWDIDFGRLEQLDSEAADESESSGRLLARAHAIRILMKEFSSRLRPRGA